MQASRLPLLSLVQIASGVGVIQRNVSMSGMRCGWPSDQQDGLLIYPADLSNKYPAVSFAHGWDFGGDTLQDVYDGFLSFLASAEYVILAPKAPYSWEFYNWCDEEWKDQLQALVWAKTAPEVKQHIDFSRASAVVGHSMGGRATVQSASQNNAEVMNIGAAVAMHPTVGGFGCSGCSPRVPIMFTSGSNDVSLGADPWRADELYNSTKGVAKAFVELQGATHDDMQDGSPNYKHLEWHYVLDWLNCFIKRNATACSLAQCREPRSSNPTSVCRVEGVVVPNLVV
jgi:dienelactone hydrolase